MTEPKQVFTEDLLDDYPTSPVPEHRTVGGIRIGLVNGALAFAVPGLVTGLELGVALGIIEPTGVGCSSGTPQNAARHPLEPGSLWTLAEVVVQR